MHVRFPTGEVRHVADDYEPVLRALELGECELIPAGENVLPPQDPGNVNPGDRVEDEDRVEKAREESETPEKPKRRNGKRATEKPETR